MTNACFQDHASTRLSRRKEEPLQEQVDDKPTQKETKSAKSEDERRFKMKLPYENTIDIPDSFFRLKMLQMEEAKETNNLAELAATTHESQSKSARTRTNPILYSLNVLVTSCSREDDYRKSVKVSKNKSGY